MNEEAVNCPSCGGEIDPVQKRCAHCGCWLGVRGISFYAFWVGLSLVVTALLAFMFYIGFQMLNRML